MSSEYERYPGAGFCVVVIWKGGPPFYTGHVSMVLPGIEGDNYISFSTPNDAKDYKAVLSGILGSEGRRKSFQDDKDQSEIEEEIIVSPFDVHAANALKEELYTDDTKYDLFNNNCSTVVAMLILAGICADQSSKNLLDEIFPSQMYGWNQSDEFFDDLAAGRFAEAAADLGAPTGAAYGLMSLHKRLTRSPAGQVAKKAITPLRALGWGAMLFNGAKMGLGFVWSPGDIQKLANIANEPELNTIYRDHEYG